jgi:oxygen-independent coproporphyrinogen-3 oxidase
MVLDGKIKMVDENFDADQYAYTIEFLGDNDFLQYEVSNFCKPNFECVHNNYYWKYKDYLSFGTSSHSFINGRRWWNYSSLKFYLESIKRKSIAVRGQEEITLKQSIDEIIMLALRGSGLNIKEFSDKFGNEWLKKRKVRISEFISNGFLREDKRVLRCSAKGYAVCDEIISQLLK